MRWLLFVLVAALVAFGLYVYYGDDPALAPAVGVYTKHLEWNKQQGTAVLELTPDGRFTYIFQPDKPGVPPAPAFTGTWELEGELVVFLVEFRRTFKALHGHIERVETRTFKERQTAALEGGAIRMWARNSLSRGDPFLWQRHVLQRRTETPE